MPLENVKDIPRASNYSGGRRRRTGIATGIKVLGRNRARWTKPPVRPAQFPRTKLKVPVQSWTGWFPQDTGPGGRGLTANPPATAAPTGGSAS